MSFMLGITPWPVASAILWIVFTIAALYLIRSTAHKTIQAATQGLHRSFRIASKAVSRSEVGLAVRNRDVLLAAGREAKERIIEREFDRINETVRKDLANYSGLHRKLSESIGRIEKDHQEAVDVPPDPPGWVKAVKAGGSSGVTIMSFMLGITPWPVASLSSLHLASAGWPGKLDSIAMSIIDQADKLPIRLEEIDHPDLKTDDDWPQLIVTLDGRTLQEIKLVTSRSLIGRSILSDIVIDDEFVSAQHALLIRDHGRVILVDLKSASGTFVNSRNVQTTVLRNNDIISLGDHRIKMIYPNSLAPEEIDDPDLSDTARMRRIAGAQHVNNGDTGIATQSRLVGKA